MLATEDWMAAVGGRRGADQVRLYADLYLPGTHNSSTSSIKLRSRAVPGTLFWLAKPVAVPWSTCQRSGVYEQLMRGIRVFDLRTCRIQGSVNEVYTCHGFCNAKLEQHVLREEFLRFRQAHPKEIITIFIKLDWDYAQSLASETEREAEARAHLAIVQRVLGEYVYCAKADEDDGYVLGDLWRAGKSFVVMPRTARVQWLNARTPQDLYARADLAMQARAADGGGGGLFVLQLVLTPSAGDVCWGALTSCFGGGGGGLCWFERRLNASVAAWVRYWQQKYAFKFSIMVDFYEDSGVVEACIRGGD